MWILISHLNYKIIIWFTSFGTGMHGIAILLDIIYTIEWQCGNSIRNRYKSHYFEDKIVPSNQKRNWSDSTKKRKRKKSKLLRVGEKGIKQAIKKKKRNPRLMKRFVPRELKYWFEKHVAKQTRCKIQKSYMVMFFLNKILHYNEKKINFWTQLRYMKRHHSRFEFLF